MSLTQSVYWAKEASVLMESKGVHGFGLSISYAMWIPSLLIFSIIPRYLVSLAVHSPCKSLVSLDLLQKVGWWEWNETEWSSELATLASQCDIVVVFVGIIHNQVINFSTPTFNKHTKIYFIRYIFFCYYFSDYLLYVKTFAYVTYASKCYNNSEKCQFLFYTWDTEA